MRYVLFHGKGLISWSIRAQTRSHWSHAALLIDDSTIIEAWQGSGVRKKRIEDWDNTKTFEVETTKEQDAAILSFARSKIGQPYDYRNVARFITRTAPHPDDRWFCSELVFAAFCSGGIHLFARIPAARVSPGMLEWTPLAQAL